MLKIRREMKEKKKNHPRCVTECLRAKNGKINNFRFFFFCYWFFPVWACIYLFESLLLCLKKEKNRIIFSGCKIIFFFFCDCKHFHSWILAQNILFRYTLFLINLLNVFFCVVDPQLYIFVHLYEDSGVVGVCLAPDHMNSSSVLWWIFESWPHSLDHLRV